MSLVLPPNYANTHAEFSDLHRYLGPAFRLNWCDASDEKGHKEANNPIYSDNDQFCRNTMVFAYQSIGLMSQGIHRPYIAKLLELTADKGPCTILEFGAGAGQLGLALHTMGYKVSFADLNSQSLLFLEWRLKERRLNNPVYILDFGVDTIPKHDIVTCFDVIEHCAPDIQLQVIHQCAKLGDSVFMNLIKGDGTEIPGLHFEVDLEKITEYVRANWPCWSCDYYPDKDGNARQRLLVFGDKVVVGSESYSGVA